MRTAAGITCISAIGVGVVAQAVTLTFLLLFAAVLLNVAADVRGER